MGHISAKLKTFVRASLCLILSVAIINTLYAPAVSANNSWSEFSDYWKTIFKENNILFWNPYEAGSKPKEDEDKCSTGKRSTLKGKGNIAKIVNYYSGNNSYGIKLTAEGIAGILGNFKVESGFSPFRNQGNGSSLKGAYGVAQFDPRSKILLPLQWDSRTSGYFKEYYTDGAVTYGGPTDESGIPAGVPDEVDTAFLSVELDFLTTSEGTKTRVGSYRNLGGHMGLDYIPDNATIYEALNLAKSASDAARVFLWIYERPADKPGNAPTRGSNAEGYLQTVKDLMNGNSDDEELVCENGAAIAKKAIELAWPNSDGTTCGNDTLITWNFTDKVKACKDIIKKSYAEAAIQAGHSAGAELKDCGRFASTVIRTSGADKDFPLSGTSNMHPYLKKSTKWLQVADGKLQPGDVLINTSGSTHHIVIYVGDAYGESNVYASASQNERSSNLSKGSYSSYDIFRLVNKTNNSNNNGDNTVVPGTGE